VEEERVQKNETKPNHEIGESNGVFEGW